MSTHKFTNYLKTYRKQTNLNQKELAFLFGDHSAAKISRYENLIRAPSLQALLCYSLIFEVSPQNLFIDQCEEIRKLVRRKALVLIESLNAKPSNPITTKKIKFLTELINHWETINTN